MDIFFVYLIHLVVSVFDTVAGYSGLVAGKADFLALALHIVYSGFYLNPYTFEGLKNDIVNLFNNLFYVFGIGCNYEMIVGKSGKKAVLEFLSDGECNSAKEFITFLESVFFIKYFEVYDIEMNKRNVFGFVFGELGKTALNLLIERSHVEKPG